MMTPSRVLPYLGLVLSTLLLVGCGRSEATDDPRVAAQRSKYLLQSEPGEAVSILELREAVQSDQEVVVVGKIGGVADPWTKGRAAFVMSDPALAAAGECSHESCPGCPFCAKKAKSTDGLALVEVVDDQGHVVPIDARQLLGVDTDQTVVVRGRARLDDLGYLVVSARGCYVRR